MTQKISRRKDLQTPILINDYIRIEHYEMFIRVTREITGAPVPTQYEVGVVDYNNSDSTKSHK